MLSKLSIPRGTKLYRFLDWCFTINQIFLGKIDYSCWVREKGLEASDFCRQVRVSMIYTPLIFLLQYGSIAAITWFAFVRPYLMVYNPFGAFLPILLTVAAFFVFLVVVVAGTVAVEKIKDKLEDMKAARSVNHTPVSNVNHTPVSKKPDLFKQFLSNVYLSIKEKFCPLVEFTGETK